MKTQARMSLALHYVAALVMSICLAQSSYAATFNITHSGTEGGQELVQAVANANTQTGSTHTIAFSSTVKSIILNEEVPIRSNIIINGLGAEISGSGGFRLFRITNGRTVFNRVTLTNGQASGNGGAVEVAGTNASAEFNNCTLWGNRASGSGGAVCITEGNERDMTMFTHCTIAGNSAEDGGGISLIAGAANTYASIVIGNSSPDISGNVQTYTTITGNDYTTAQVLLTDSNGMPELSEVNGIRVIKLSSGSPALDFIAAQNSYTLDIDEAGTSRPQLFGYDLGAYEALPINVESVIIAGQHYMQVGTTEQFTLSVTPADASRNIQAHPPEGIVWTTLNTSTLSVDPGSGLVSALNTGEGYVTATLYGWDSKGGPKYTRSDPFYVRAGIETRQLPVITMTEIADITMAKNEYKTITPSVAITENEYPVTAYAGVNYQLDAVAMSSGIVTAAVSGDSVVLMAWDNVGSCDVRVTARPIPEGSSVFQDFHVTVSERPSLGGSGGGGGCNSGMFTLAGIIMLTCMYKKGRR